MVSSSQAANKDRIRWDSSLTADGPLKVTKEGHGRLAARWKMTTFHSGEMACLSCISLMRPIRLSGIPWTMMQHIWMLP